jgi:Transposase DDE domain group 1
VTRAHKYVLYVLDAVILGRQGSRAEDDSSRHADDAGAEPAARRWEPKKLRLRLFSAAGRIVRGGRRLKLRLSARWPATQITAAISRLQALAPG